MSARLRVLGVDDAGIVRRLIGQALPQLPDMAVLGLASEGHIARHQIGTLKPEVVTLDLDMPHLGGRAQGILPRFRPARPMAVSA